MRNCTRSGMVADHDGDVPREVWDAARRARAALDTGARLTGESLASVGRTRWGGATVLVIDDDPEIRTACAALLTAEGFAVDEAQDGAEALARLDLGAAPSLIVLDYQMPAMDGLRFRAEQVKRARLAAIPVVVCSATDQPLEIRRTLAVQEWLRKPVDPETLVRSVRRYTGPVVSASGS
jgi:two-component system, chemotaxis family, chemotaxis protein CheY